MPERAAGRSLLLAAAWVAACPAAAAGAAWDAPLRLGTGGTFGSLFLELTAADARALPTPELEVRWSLENDWGTPMVLTRGSRRVAFQADEQADVLGASLRWPWAAVLGPGPALGRHGLWQRLSTSAELRAVVHWGGFTDEPIESWHGLIGSSDFRRSYHPRNAVRVVLQDEGGGGGIALRTPRLAIGDLVLRNQLLVADGGASAGDPARAGWGLSLRLDLKAPLGSPRRLGGSGGWDAGAAVLGTAELAAWATGHALLGVSAVSPLAVPVALRARPWRWVAELSLAVRLGDVALLIEDRVTSPIFGGGWDRVPADGVDGFMASGYYGAFLPQNRVSVGLRSGPWTFWLSEDWTPGAAPHSRGPINWFYDSNAPDLVLGVAWASPR